MWVCSLSYVTEQETDETIIDPTSAPGHDWRKDVVPVFGQRLNALRTLVAESQVSLCEQYVQWAL